jgi:uncharacterized protein YceK
MISLAFLVTTQSGCGTFYNLNASIDGNPWKEIDQGRLGCAPMGGVTRSAVLACDCVVNGSRELVENQCKEFRGEATEQDRENSKFYLGLGLYAIVDTPCSLVADVLTLPVVAARYCEHSWETWWNEHEWQIHHTGASF